MLPAHEQVPLERIYDARARLDGEVLRTPLVHLEVEDGGIEIHLKLENLQPIGSFKLRGALNALGLADRDQLAAGVWTASAGNMGQGVAWVARRLGVPCTVVVPDGAPAAKTDALARLGATVVGVPLAQWLEVFRTRRHGGLEGAFVHPFSDSAVMAGNGTIALEILDDLPDVDAVIVPYGGGGLCCGIGSAIRALAPQCRVYACEVETAAPLAASLAAGEPTEVDYKSSFVDGIGAPVVFPEMFDLARRLVESSIVTTLSGVASAIRLLLERQHVVAEGAGAAPVAAALTGEAGTGKIACVVSGGNIDSANLMAIAASSTP